MGKPNKKNVINAAVLTELNCHIAPVINIVMVVQVFVGMHCFGARFESFAYLNVYLSTLLESVRMKAMPYVY